ncbi:MAG: site-2 protease family protein [Planctomycetes bacterium]|nr:site-2 protease family protein [Planctomycetota bacterium]
MSPEVVDGILLFTVLVVSLTVHEAAHALVAMLGGDRTAYLGGQVTLNPIPHMRREPFGMLILPLIVIFGSGGSMCMGFAHAPIDPHWAARHPRRAALMSAAGPLSNFLLAGIAVLALMWMRDADLVRMSVVDHLSFVRASDGNDYVHAAGRILSVFAFLNGILGVFNLFPWPPLDGAGVVEGLLPRQTGRFFESVRHQPTMMIVGILVVWYAMREIVPEIYFLLRDWIGG